MDELKIKAAATITEFMGGLAGHYNRETMRELWRTMEKMQAKFGTVYVAEAVKKDPKDAELALFRYNQHLFRKAAEREDPDINLIWDRPIRWHHVTTTKKHRLNLRNILPILCVCCIILAAYAVIGEI